jgi:hypothetical protein
MNDFKFILYALIPIGYAVMGVYLIKNPIDLGTNLPPYLPGGLLVAYGLFRAYRVWRQYQDER